MSYSARELIDWYESKNHCRLDLDGIDLDADDAEEKVREMLSAMEEYNDDVRRGRR